MKKSYWRVKACYRLTVEEILFLESTSTKVLSTYKLSAKEKETIDAIWYRLFRSERSMMGDKILEASEKRWFGSGLLLTVHYKKFHALNWMRNWDNRSDKEMADFLMGAMQNHVRAYQVLISVVYESQILE